MAGGSKGKCREARNKNCASWCGYGSEWMERVCRGPVQRENCASW